MIPFLLRSPLPSRSIGSLSNLDRFNRLHAGFTNTTFSEGGEGNEDLLRGIAVAAGEARELVPRSQGRHYDGGKLRLRNDLNVAASTLDAHVARLDEICASGALTRARALVVPRTAAGASRDDVQFYVCDLFTRLSVAGAEMQREAPTALNEVLCDDEKYVQVVVSDVTDRIGVLVGLLECLNACV